MVQCCVSSELEGESKTRAELEEKSQETISQLREDLANCQRKLQQR